MGFWSNLFGRKEQEQQIVSDNSNRDMYGFANIERNDGTMLQIKELLDKEGNQQYQTVIDQRTGEQVPIPQYVIMRMNEKNEFRQDIVLMELPAEALQNPQYANWIANDMLSEQNISKVLNEQHGYVGGVQTRGGEIIRTVYRPGIIETLEQQKEAEKNAKLMEGIRGMAQEKYDIYNAASKHEVNIKTSHAEKLNPEMLKGRNSGGQDR